MPASLPAKSPSQLPPAPTPASASRTAAAESCPVIYADRVVLGSGYPQRLRVVCFETPRADVRGFRAGR